jgi:hypothetical protein
MDFDYVTGKIDIGTFLKHGYMSKRDWYVEFISDCIHAKIGVPDITLGDLYEKTGKLFVVNTVSKNEKRMIYLSAVTHPEWTLIDAICATTAYPLVFDAFTRNIKNIKTGVITEDTFIDGGLVNNYIAEVFPPDETLGLYLGRRMPTFYSPVNTEKGKGIGAMFPGVGLAIKELGGYFAILSFNIEIAHQKKVLKRHGRLPREIQIVVDGSVQTLSFAELKKRKMEIFLSGISIGLNAIFSTWKDWN